MPKLNDIKMSVAESFKAIPNADIDGDGRFKYVLIKVFKESDSDNFKYVVRGYKSAGYHGNVISDLEYNVQI